MSKVDCNDAPEWADRVLDTLKGDVIFSDGSYFLGTDDTKTKHSEVIDTLPNGHEILAFEYESCGLIEVRPDNWKEGEKRMEQIQQNGNDGAVYDPLNLEDVMKRTKSETDSVKKNATRQALMRMEMEERAAEAKAKLDGVEAECVSASIKNNESKYHREIKKGVLVDVYDELDDYSKQPRYKGSDGLDHIDEFARDNSIEDFRAAMRFTIDKYKKRLGKKDAISKELYKMSDYYKRWSEVEKKLEQEKG